MYKLIPLVILLAITSCKKNDGQAESTITITVKEYISALPVANAAVSLKRNGIGGNRTVFTGYTNDDGICEVPEKYFNEPGVYVDVSAMKYWPYALLSQTTRDVVLIPFGWIRVGGIKTPQNVYPNAAVINLYPVTESGFGGPLETNYHPVDTDSILLQAYGGVANAVVWQLLSSSSDTLNHGEERDIMVPRFDTIDVVLSGY